MGIDRAKEMMKEKPGCHIWAGNDKDYFVNEMSERHIKNCIRILERNRVKCETDIGDIPEEYKVPLNNPLMWNLPSGDLAALEVETAMLNRLEDEAFYLADMETNNHGYEYDNIHDAGQFAYVHAAWQKALKKLDFVEKWIEIFCMELHHRGADVSKEKRMARCSYYGKKPNGRNHSGWGCNRGEVCKCERVSAKELAFFSENSDKEYDKFYCGCFGWE